ncbi:class III lanthionine synthetase LanKC [Streptosporangium minutum]|uniref:class III lanthionine synthetase LanKC n=1 Tax=Streptosporangium minutum TaxID=569862 RepID=UPI000A38BE5A|nr:class III lanthionine synthetase LanKC [Streptosporangium minutum]
MKETLPQLVAYCQADPLFFEPVWRIPDDDSRFPTARRPLPSGWRVGESELWVVLLPPDAALPEQGWKIHVSATDADAATVCDLVVDFCVSRNIAVKFLRSKMAMRLLNNKYADRGSSGKLITLYPADEEQLSEVLPELAGILRDFTGPYILSDLRYEDSPVYVRYGAFQPMTYTKSDGSLGYAIRTPDGRLVPDQRTPAFTVPEWVSIPEVLRASVAKHGSGGEEEFPYQIERALHFSNGGGVYLARDGESGGYVVLLEARPHAGLDTGGVDAVARLAHERDILERLSDLDCVPRLLDYRVIWEHHFLVEEYIEGKTLMDEVFERYPLVSPDPTAESLASYTRWATDVLAKVDHALMSVHAKGVRFADLHPENIIVRPDGRVALIDFEIASDLTDPRPPGLAAAGFAAPKDLSGREADNYVLNCLRQWVFLPISPLQERDPVKLSSLTDVVTEHFPLPPAFGPRLVRQFSAVKGPLGEDRAARMFDAGDPGWPAIRDSLVAGINASATPDRRDRLFPGDPQQFATGGFTVANGAAGVLWALRQAGAAVPADYVDWLVAAARRAPDPRPGLLNGLHGVAATLESLGRRDDALDMLDRARKLHDGLAVPGLHGGLAGAGLNLLHFSELTGDEGLLTEALDIGERLAAELGDGDSGMFTPQGRVGLEHGLTGVASYFLRLHGTTGETRHLDLAGLALRREIGRGQVLPDGGFCLLESNRYLAYLGTGSGGLALVLSQYLGRRAEPDFADVVDGVRRACRAPFVRHPSLFMGRAGTIATFHLLGRPEDRPVLREHVRRLGWHALLYQGHLAFPGNQLMRLSMDLETGSAGVLVALSVAFNQSASVIPVLDLRSPAFEATERKQEDGSDSPAPDAQRL